MNNKGSVNSITKEQHRQQFSNWLLWLDRAKELTRAARILDAHVDKDWSDVRHIINNTKNDTHKQIAYPKLQDIQFMLYSYALENYFKAIIIFTDPTISEKPAKIKTHKLPQLAKYAKFQVTPKETELLSRLWRNVDWQGRYPVPLSPEKISSKYYTDGNRDCSTVYSSEDRSAIKQLFERVVSHVNSITKQSEIGNF
jgi:hypothetical protein